MLVKELIEKLQQLDPNKECLQYHWDWDEEELYLDEVKSVSMLDDKILID